MDMAIRMQASLENGSSKENFPSLDVKGLEDSLHSLDSAMLQEEFIQQLPVKGDDHLIEFSEAMRTVAKALRQVAEGKAAAQAEAAEWKRRYELERARNLQLMQRELSVEGNHPKSQDGIFTNASDLSKLLNLANEQTERCCGAHGICSDEILRVDSTSSDSKARFSLAWGCDGEMNGQHKHDIVSFERGNITTAARSSKQVKLYKWGGYVVHGGTRVVFVAEAVGLKISLKWESAPKTVVILTKPNSDSVRIFCSKVVRWLNDHKKIIVLVEPRVRHELLAESPDFSFVQSWQHDEELLLLHTKIDLIVTLGGDGTVLWFIKQLQYTKLINSSCLSDIKLGELLKDLSALLESPVRTATVNLLFVANISLHPCSKDPHSESENYQDCLNEVLRGPISITLRHRLQCRVIRSQAKDKLETEESIIVLNEVTIDRGISCFLADLECYCDNSFMTRVQGDGLILSTTSGSTAYSLAAGGSMVPGILFTPICPHSLSFRPLILPEYVTLRVQVPLNSRGNAWASFDGKDRKELAAGDALICSMAPWPVPTVCQVDSTSDFLRSIHEGLHWNLRKTQLNDGPRGP
ncbi:hypothetical protein ACLOJK_025303 [Asimina triloba]